MLCPWPFWDHLSMTASLAIQDHVMRIHGLIRDPPHADSDARFAAWQKHCYQTSCHWVDESDVVLENFGSYFSSYCSAITTDALLPATFVWDGPETRVKAIFMAERELGVLPYTLLHPLFMTSVVATAATLRLLGRTHGSPHNMDPEATIIEWGRARGDSTADNGVSARIKPSPPRRDGGEDEKSCPSSGCSDTNNISPSSSSTTSSNSSCSTSNNNPTRPRS
jgi:hypothetical protein